MHAKGIAAEQAAWDGDGKYGFAQQPDLARVSAGKLDADDAAGELTAFGF